MAIFKNLDGTLKSELSIGKGSDRVNIKTTSGVMQGKNYGGSYNNLLMGSLSAGQIPFQSASSGILSGSANLLWDSVNNRLGIGNPASISAKLTVRGEGTTNATKTLSLLNSSSVEQFFVLDNGDFGTSSTALNGLFYDNTNKRLTIAKSSGRTDLRIDKTTGATGEAGVILFRGVVTGTTVDGFAGIYANIVNYGSYGTYTGKLSFYHVLNGVWKTPLVIENDQCTITIAVANRFVIGNTAVQTPNDYILNADSDAFRGACYVNKNASANASAGIRMVVSDSAVGSIRVVGNSYSISAQRNRLLIDNSFETTNNSKGIWFGINSGNSPDFIFGNSAGGTVYMRLDDSANLSINTSTPSAKLTVKGSGTTSATKTLSLLNSSSVEQFIVYDNGSLSTADPSSGAGKWKLGKKVTATVSLVTTDYIEVDIDGTLYKLGLVT